MSAGVYIHIPFCRSRCSYCDFATGLYQKELPEKYVAAVVKEVEQWQGVAQPLEVDTIYFGGGTPSLLYPEQVDKILGAVKRRFVVASLAEVTMEMNPGSISKETLSGFRNLGINRASFGAQTFDDRELARLGRSHTTAETLQTFRDLRLAGFENVSFDLIAGLPGQTLKAWGRNVEISLQLRPDHLSFYLLEVHEGTPLAEHIRKGSQPQPDEDLAAAMYEMMLEMSVAAGYVHYEISNLCLPGLESCHNSKYWSGLPYYGFGCSAHSFDGCQKRWANERDVKAYVEKMESGESPIVQTWSLNEQDRRAESVFLGLRLMKGINLREYQEEFAVDVRTEYREDFERLLAAGLIEVRGDLLRLTRAGALLSNEVFAAFV